MNRTALCALAAVGTFFRVDVRTVVLDGDCAKFADALTFFTADTAVGAYLSGVRTLFMVHAGHINLLASWQNLQNGVRANLCTGAASNAQILVDLCNVVYDMDSIIFTGSGTVTITQAGKITAGSAVIQQFGSLTGLWTIIIHDILAGLQMTAAFDNRAFWLDAADRYTQDFTQFGCNRCTADRTQVWLCLTCCHLGSVFVTACTAASTTVGARQLLSELCYSFVHLYCEELGGYAQQKSRNQTCSCNDEDRH